MPASCRFESSSTEDKKPCGCMPDKALDYDVIDLPFDKEACKKKILHPLEMQHELAVRGMLGIPTCQDQPNLWADVCGTGPPRPHHPVHIAPKSYIEQLRKDVLQEKNLRKRTQFPNYLAQLGRTGSYHWPNQFFVDLPSQLEKPNYFVTTKPYKTLPVYDCVYKQEVPLNPYKYMYTLHREDRAHAKHTGLDINGEELSRPRPGILTNTEYGRRNNDSYLHPNERYHRVRTHKSFYRHRGVDGSR